MQRSHPQKFQLEKFRQYNMYVTMVTTAWIKKCKVCENGKSTKYKLHGHYSAYSIMFRHVLSTVLMVGVASNDSVYL